MEMVPDEDASVTPGIKMGRVDRQRETDNRILWVTEKWPEDDVKRI